MQRHLITNRAETFWLGWPSVGGPSFSSWHQDTECQFWSCREATKCQVEGRISAGQRTIQTAHVRKQQHISLVPVPQKLVIYFQRQKIYQLNNTIIKQVNTYICSTRDSKNESTKYFNDQKLIINWYNNKKLVHYLIVTNNTYRI